MGRPTLPGGDKLGCRVGGPLSSGSGPMASVDIDTENTQIIRETNMNMHEGVPK